MALKECPECGADVSERARACPQCGFTRGTNPAIIIVWIIAALMVAALIGGIIAQRGVNRTLDEARELSRRR